MGVEDGWKASKMMSRAQSSVSANYTVMCQSGPRRKYQGKLTLIKEFSEDGAGPAYKWLPTQVEDLKLAGVNVKPRQWHDLVIPHPRSCRHDARIRGGGSWHLPCRPGHKPL